MQNTIISEGLQRVEASDIIDAVRSYSAERSVMDEATEIPIDYTLLADERMHSVTSQLNPIDASKGIEIQAVTGEESELEIETHDTPKGGGATSTQTASSAETDEGRLLGKQLATYYAQILFYAFLTDTPVSSLEDLIASIGQCANNKRIARNVGLQASILQIIQTESNPFVLRALDYKIANINTLVSGVYSAIKSINPQVQFGISPQGNITNDLNMGADVETWASQKGYVDYLCPQIYVNFDHPLLPFNQTADQWRQMTTAEGVKLYIGLAVYKAGSEDADSGTWNGKTDILQREIEYSRSLGCDGIMLYSWDYMDTSHISSEKKIIHSLRELDYL